jgi:hypothetical protein
LDFGYSRYRSTVNVAFYVVNVWVSTHPTLYAPLSGVAFLIASSAEFVGEFARIQPDY